MRKLLSVSVLLLSVLILGGCGSDEPSDDFGNETGIKGKVMVQNEFQQPLYEDRAGINVKFEVGYQDFATTTDNTGNWLLSGAPVGTYTLTFSKAGYSRIVKRSVKVSNTVPDYPVDHGFQQLPTVTITKLPLTDFADFTMTLDILTGQGGDTSYSLEISATMLPAPPPTGQAKGYRIFIGKDEAVSPQNYLFQEYHATTDAQISLSYDNAWFEEHELVSGDALYAVIYGDVSFNQEIEKPDGELMFPNISQNPGGFASVVLP